MPARDLWARIQKQLRVLQTHLGELHDEWKGPYKELRDRLRRRAERLEGHETTRSRAGHHDPFHVKRQGDAQIGIVGVPNAGKSFFVQALTGAATVIADYPYATQHPVPGMLSCVGGTLQLVDTPPLVAGLAAGEGAGRPLLHLLSLMDALAVTVDLSADVEAQLQLLREQLADTEVYPVAGPLATVFHPKGKEGLKFGGQALSRAQEAVARGIVEAAHVEHAEVTIRGAFSEPELRAQVDGEILTPTVLLGTRAEAEDAEAGVARLRAAPEGFRVVVVDPQDPQTLAAAMDTVRAALGLVTVSLLSRPTPDADAEPLLVPLGSDVAHVALRLSSRPPKTARVWGDSVDRAGQTVRLQHLVAAGDRIFLQS